MLIRTSYRFDRGALAVDVLWFDWSSAHDEFVFNLKNGDNPAFDAIAGTRPSDAFPLDWRDSYTVRVGGEYFLTRADTLRAGYTYMSNPIPDGTLTPILPANIEHAVSVGYGHRFDFVSLDLAYQFSFGRRQRVGTSDILGGDFDDSSVRSRAHTIFVGVSFEFGRSLSPESAFVTPQDLRAAS